MNRPGKKFERLIAAIHKVQSKDTEVIWDERIDGRQFDVTIRFKIGLYNYLTLIECKDYSSRVPVKEVEAFVTKSRSAKANKAIMVTSSSFQKGCEKVAEENDIELLVFREAITQSDITYTGKDVTTLNVLNIKLKKTDGEYFKLPRNPSGRLDFLMKNIRIVKQDKQPSLEDIINAWQLHAPTIMFAKPTRINLHLGESAVAVLPLNEGTFAVSSLCFECKLILAKELQEGSLDIYVQWRMAEVYSLLDPKGNIMQRVPARDVQVGFDTVFKNGHFYEAPQTGFYYYCEEILGNEVSMIMVESYQHGQLFAAKFTMDKQYSSKYIEVDDQKTISRLMKLLKKIRGS